MAKAVPHKDIQISMLVDPNRPRAILSKTRQWYLASYPPAGFNRVHHVFFLTWRLYQGRFPGYRPCLVEYHDFAHVTAVLAATSRLLDGCELSGLGLGPVLGSEVLIAALLHDTGYILKKGAEGGTGAQYTKTHVDRSAAFTLSEAEAFGLDAETARRISRIILGTDLGRPWESLVFDSDPEQIAAEILAAADLLAQMADRIYLEKLLFLYYEFREAGIEGYDKPFDILKKTAGFYASTQNRLDDLLGRVSSRMAKHFEVRHGVPKDLYREAIVRQMVYLDSIIADSGTDFRTKLKRMDLSVLEGAGLRP